MLTYAMVVWEYQSAEIELAQGKAIADACQEVGIEYLIWSTLSHAANGIIPCALGLPIQVLTEQ
jgi:hypothetical protein